MKLSDFHKKTRLSKASESQSILTLKDFRNV